MASHGDSECTLREGDLAAKDFDDKWKKDTNFIEFSDAALLSKKINDMEKWIFNFNGQLLTLYDLTYLDKFGHLEDKRCRDLNYYINYILHYIPKITKKTNDVEVIMQTFKAYVQAKFNSWIKFKCKFAEKEYSPKMDLIKELDDYCENRNDFKDKLKMYNKITCCKYANHVKDRKHTFHRYILSGHVKKDDEDFNIDHNCTLKDIGQTFPDIICNENDMSESKGDAFSVIEMNAHLSNYQQHESSRAVSGDSFNSSPTKIAFTSISTILGACLSGLYLYRHSFIGNILHNSRNKSIISQENIYDDENGKFSQAPSHYINNSEENDRFYIAYDPMNN
ncbi:PIR protein [Plasmodium ovale]|uniref:PIR protein n=1 Tax=Plasmodium ovale TaxID=36330 RepID=A0A1D3JFW2_PLAOA|nr:PIR protein [Plasmodium ovale]